MRKKIPDAIIPKKHLGQNFLINENIIQRIIDSCQISGKETILEIGPGLGALTKEIANRSDHVYAVETDKRLYDQLTDADSLKRINLIHADFLKCDLSFLPKKIKIIGNLPYQISTPIIEKLINNRRLFQDLFLTVQLEFGKRLAAKHNSKDYGSLSCFVQYYCDTKILFKIKNSCFRPIPKVTSCFIHLRLRPAKIKAKDENHLFRIIRKAFQQRRKKITNSLAPLIEKERLNKILDRLKIDPAKRAENLTLHNYVDISNLDLLQKNKEGM